jgi:hypothetical protein
MVAPANQSQSILAHKPNHVRWKLARTHQARLLMAIEWTSDKFNDEHLLDHLSVWLHLFCHLQLIDDTPDSLHRRHASNNWLSLVFVLERSRDGGIATSNSRTDSC